jgi:murein DD-endopeptidase MepM/ murein hydrolase activator NlpD
LLRGSSRFFPLFLLVLSGCATVETISPTPAQYVDKQGIYHKVRKGETLWRIAKAYQVNIDDLVQSNRITNVTRIEENQLVFIPGSKEAKDILVLRDDPQKDEFLWPLKGRIVHHFGERKGAYLNAGVGIEGREGDIVTASREGRVVFADYLLGYAYTVILDHLDGYYSIYSNNAKLLVQFGDIVSQGNQIAQVGGGGRDPHLHFEIRKNGYADNPLYYLPKL